MADHINGAITARFGTLIILMDMHNDKKKRNNWENKYKVKIQDSKTSDIIAVFSKDYGKDFIILGGIQSKEGCFGWVLLMLVTLMITHILRD